MDSMPAGRKQVTHDRIVDAAAGELRESGFSGVGVADIMKKAGLTHGGFYAHFDSREALLAEALERAGEDSRMRLQKAIASGEAKGMSRFEALVDTYLSERHLKSPRSGCPVAALGSEMSRQSAPVREAGLHRVQSLMATVQACLPAGQPPEAAAVVASQMAGALQLARALGDNARGRGHLAATRRFLLDLFGPAKSRRH
jgi:AcrR family transcriptional regulator